MKIQELLLKEVNVNIKQKKLTTLNGHSFPNKIVDFDCSHNDLTSLEGAPSTSGNFTCSYNKLTSPLIGAPKQCSYFFATNNKLTSFEGFPKIADYIYVYGNPFTSFSDVTTHIKECNGFFLPAVKTGVLAFLKLKTCYSISFYDDSPEFELVARIVNKHLQNDKDIIACQRELIENDLDEYAEF